MHNLGMHGVADLRLCLDDKAGGDLVCLVEVAAMSKKFSELLMLGL